MKRSIFFLALTMSTISYGKEAATGPMIPLLGPGLDYFKVGVDGKPYLTGGFWRQDPSIAGTMLFTGAAEDTLGKKVDLRLGSSGKVNAILSMEPENSSEGSGDSFLSRLRGKGGKGYISITTLDQDRRPRSNTRCISEQCLTVTPALCAAVLKTTGSKDFDDLVDKRDACAALATQWNSALQEPGVAAGQAAAFQLDIQKLDNSPMLEKKVFSFGKKISQNFRQVPWQMNNLESSAAAIHGLVNTCTVMFRNPVKVDGKSAPKPIPRPAPVPEKGESAL